TQRLRDIINKNITEEDIYSAMRQAIELGWKKIKLYFMMGLPGETEDDLAGIAEIAQKIMDINYEIMGKQGGRFSINVSVSNFVPKPFTPFQWDRQDDFEELERKQQLLRSEIRSKKIDYKYHDARVSRLEAVFAKGDRRLGKALAEAVRRGQRFDAWDEYFDYDRWMSVFRDCGIDPSFYANREIGEDELLPWDFLDIGVTKTFLLKERHKSRMAETTPDCRTHCSGCGAASLCRGPCSCTENRESGKGDA
ncbi:MAG: B12-binding domain-containing radical SAM protein, partial [Clostridia bacterium]|nr:B12-binding domain-containing radical SAM protein [Clostridia bacterium]